MKNNLKSKGALLLAALSMTAAMPFALKAASNSLPAASDPSAVVITVTATAKKNAQPPVLSKSDVDLYQGKERVQVADFKRGETLYLAVLIDDSLRSSLANQWSDLRAFLMAQPQSTYVAVAYARDGVAFVAQDFTTDHALAAKALRMPLGTLSAASSPYLAVQDWTKRWPVSGQRSSIILFSSGIDYFRGGPATLDPDLDTNHRSRAEEEHQRLDHLRAGFRPSWSRFIPCLQLAIQPGSPLASDWRRVLLPRPRSSR